MGGTKFKVGDIVELVGVVYEQTTFGVRIQRADGVKVRGLPADGFQPATPENVKVFQSQAIEGVSPEAIIAREAEEAAAREAAEKAKQEEEPEEE